MVPMDYNVGVGGMESKISGFGFCFLTLWKVGIWRVLKGEFFILCGSRDMKIIL